MESRLWQLKSWGYGLAFIAYSLALILNLIGGSLIGVAVCLVIVGYLAQARVREQFGP